MRRDKQVLAVQYPVDTNLEGELSIYPVDTVRCVYQHQYVACVVVVAVVVMVVMVVAVVAGRAGGLSRCHWKLVDERDK